MPSYFYRARDANGRGRHVASGLRVAHRFGVRHDLAHELGDLDLEGVEE